MFGCWARFLGLAPCKRLLALMLEETKSFQKSVSSILYLFIAALPRSRVLVSSPGDHGRLYSCCACALLFDGTNNQLRFEVWEPVPGRDERPAWCA